MLVLIAGALAADTVVYAGGDPDKVLDRIAAVSGVPADTLHAVPVADLVRGRPPTLLGGGKLEHCGGSPTTLASVRQSMDLAKGAVAYMEYGSARAALDAAIRDLGCLQEPIDAELAARAWFLTGVVAHASGDEARTRSAFRQARLFAPEMGWDENFAPAARGAFESVTAEMKATSLVSLSVVPEPPEGALRVDGRVVRVVGGHVGVLPGTHHVQVGDAPPLTMTMQVDANAPATLVLPSLVTDDALAWAGDGDRREALSSVLIGALGDEGVVYVVSNDIVWRLRLGGSAWDLVAAGARPLTAMPVPASATGASGEERPTGRRSAAGPVTLAVGGAGLIAGGVVAGLGYGAARDAVEDANTNGRSEEGDAQYEAGGQQYTAGLVVGGVGAALAVTGLVLTVTF